MKHMNKLLLVSSLFVLAACDNDDDPGNAAPEPTPTFTLQIAHASPDAPLVDVLVDGDVALEDVDYKQASGWGEFNAGTYSVTVEGILPTGNAAVIGPADLTFEGDRIYTVVAANTVDAIEPLIIDQPRTPIAAGNARVFVLHAANNVQQLIGGPVDVYVTAPMDDLSGGALDSFEYGETIGPAELPAGDYRIRVGVGDPADAQNFVLAYDSGTVALAEGDDLVLAAVPNTTSDSDISPISLLAMSSGGAGDILSDGTQTSLRVIHASSNTPAVDVYANGAVALVEGLEFPDFAPADGFLEVDAGTYSVEVATAGTYPAGVAIGPADLTFDAGVTNNVIAIGQLGGTPGTSGELTVTRADDDPRPVALYAKVRVIHASTVADTAAPNGVDIYVTAPGADIADPAITPVATGFGFADNSGFLIVPGGTYDVTVTATGSTDAAIGPAEITIVDGGVYTAIARDPLPESADLGLILIDDTASD